MKVEKIVTLIAILACSVLLTRNAWGVMACTITASPATLSGAYDPASNLDMQGSFAINCTRAKNDSKNQTLWVGLNQVAGQTMAKSAPYADTLTYGIYTDAARATRWTSGAGGGLAIPLAFAGNEVALPVSAAFYMRAGAGQTDKASGTYSDTLNVTLNLTDSLGQNLGNTTLTSQATVAKSCSVSVAAVSYSVNYQAFRSTSLIDSTQSVGVTCSKGTQVNLALDQVTGVILPIELTYGLVFSPSSQTASGTSTSGSAAQNFGLTLTLPAGQAGACTGAVCSGVDTRQITVTY